MSAGHAILWILMQGSQELTYTMLHYKHRAQGCVKRTGSVNCTTQQWFVTVHGKDHGFSADFT